MAVRQTRQRTLAEPARLAYLGELVRLCLCTVEGAYFDGSASELVVRAGSPMFGTPNRRELFFLRPRLDGKRVRPDDRAAHAMDLHERFMNQQGTGFYNIHYPEFGRPVFAGYVVAVHYLAEKKIPLEADELEEGDEPDDDPGELEYVHFFQGPEGPAFPELWGVGHSQFYVPPGPFRVEDAGIDYFRDR